MIDTISHLATWNGIYGIIALNIIFFIILFVCAYKAGSFYFFWEWIWRLGTGRKTFHDSELNEAWSEVLDIEMFRFKTGLDVNSSEEIKKVLVWIKQKPLSLKELIPAAKFFNVKILDFFEGNYRKKAILYGIYMAVCMMFISVPRMYPEWSQQARLTINETGTVFWYDGKNAFEKQRVFTEENCKPIEDKININQVIFSDEEVICSFVLGDDKEKFKSGLSMQRFAIVLYLLAFLIFFINFFVLFGRSIAVDKIIRKLASET